MIPRLIHYCWFGKTEIPKLALKCMDSWKTYFPGWELRLWNEENSPMQAAYMQTAYQNKNWSNMTNFMRLHALKNFGGIYLDTDVEVIKPFDFLDKYACFLGFENSKSGAEMSINNAVIGAVKAHPFISQSYDRLLAQFDGREASYLSGPGLTTDLLKGRGLTINGEQEMEDIHIFSRERFHPFDWNDIFSYDCVKPGTYTIHYWSLSWKDLAAELKDQYAEKQRLEKKLEDANQYIAGLHAGRMKGTALMKMNINYLKNSFKRS